jgi:hypothetical protein
VSLTRGWNGKKGNLFSFSLPTTLVLLWACAPERAYNFQKHPRGCFSPDRRLKTVFQLSEQAINSKKHFPDWGTPPSTVQIHKTVRRRNLQTDQDRSRLPRSQMSLQRRGTRLAKYFYRYTERWVGRRSEPSLDPRFVSPKGAPVRLASPLVLKPRGMSSTPHPSNSVPQYLAHYDSFPSQTHPGFRMGR